MPWARDLGSIWEAQQAGAFIVPRIREPHVDFERRPINGGTAQLREFLRPEQLAALLEFAAGLPPCIREAA